MTDHLCPSAEAHERFIAHTAEALIMIGEAVYPGDPVKATEWALTGAGWEPGEFTIRLRPQRPMDTSDIDPATGEEFGVGPDIDPDAELSVECERDLNEQEAGQ